MRHKDFFKWNIKGDILADIYDKALSTKKYIKKELITN